MRARNANLTISDLSHPSGRHAYIRKDSSMTENIYANRIKFLADDQVMEVDFSEITFDVSKSVNEFYDEIDRRIEATGQKWFFLVKYLNCRIMTEAWIAFAYRGKKLNLAYSLGTARYAASEDTSEAILERSKEEQFDPNLFSTRGAALTHLRALRSEIRAADYQTAITKESEPPGKSVDERITFHSDLEIMEVDFSNCVFATSADVNAFYDTIGAKIAETNRDWYFMVNYENTEILPDAWYRWTVCSKRLNTAHSLGTVRFSAHEATKEAIENRARAHAADSNLVSSRDEALALIAETRKAAAS
ncbi:MAG: hypothetical protein GY789_09340 [Hyphomicrobiales bacterium]|nr:hypothetical protein [Hyphomicrobiales bacterium]